jgi:hypothetical protein
MSGFDMKISAEKVNDILNDEEVKRYQERMDNALESLKAARQARSEGAAQFLKDYQEASYSKNTRIIELLLPEITPQLQNAAAVYLEGMNNIQVKLVVQFDEISDNKMTVSKFAEFMEEQLTELRAKEPDQKNRDFLDSLHKFVTTELFSEYKKKLLQAGVKEVENNAEVQEKVKKLANAQNVDGIKAERDKFIEQQPKKIRTWTESLTDAAKSTLFLIVLFGGTFAYFMFVHAHISKGCYQYKQSMFSDTTKTIIPGIKCRKFYRDNPSYCDCSHLIDDGVAFSDMKSTCQSLYTNQNKGIFQYPECNVMSYVNSDQQFHRNSPFQPPTEDMCDSGPPTRLPCTSDLKITYGYYEPGPWDPVGDGLDLWNKLGKPFKTALTVIVIVIASVIALVIVGFIIKLAVKVS